MGSLTHPTRNFSRRRRRSAGSSRFVVRLNSISLPDDFRISDAPRVLDMLGEHSPGRDPHPPVAPISEDEAGCRVLYSANILPNSVYRKKLRARLRDSNASLSAFPV